MGRRLSPSSVGDTERLQALHATGLLESGPEESFERLGNLARRLTGAPTALVSLVDEDRQRFKCCLGLAEPWASAGETPLSHSICKLVVDTPGPLIITDAASDPRLVGNSAVDELGVMAYLGIPLVGTSGHVLGSLCVIDDRPRSWSDADMDAITDVAAAVMAEIELRELLTERDLNNVALARSESRLRAIMDGLFIFAGLLDVDGTVLDANKAALEAAGLTPADVVGRPFWDSYWWSWDDTASRQLRQAVELAAQGHLSRYDAVVRLGENRFIPIDFQLAPLIEDGEVVRLIPSGLDITERKRFEQELARLAAAETGHRQRAEDLLELSRVLNAATTIDQVSAGVADFGSRVAGAAYCNVAMAAPDRAELQLRHGDRLSRKIRKRWRRIPLDRSTPLGAAVVTDEPQFVTSQTAMRSRFPGGAEDAEAAGFHALAALPVPMSDAAVGFAWTEPVEFDTAIVGTLHIVAELTGQALGRATDHERNRRVAEQLQLNLLPQQLPDVPGMELGSRYEAGADGLDIGGDWFDVGVLARDRWVMAVGDVVGRGLNAAVIMGRLRNAFATLAANSVNLELLIERLDLAAAEFDDAGFSTMVAVEYSATTREITVMSAGHPAPLLRRADGRVEFLEGSGRPLGLHHGRDRRLIRRTLAAGDLLLLYTDGLVERRNESIDEGLGRLVKVVKAAGPDTAQAVCDAVVTSLAADSSDDVAVLAMLVTPELTGREPGTASG